MQIPERTYAKPNFTSIKSSFSSDGIQCAATLRLAVDSDKPMPAILMVHGWGGVQDALTPPFYEEFCRAGFAVMTFDYRGWGESEGDLRNTIDPKQRVRDANAALEHLKSFPEIDSKKIVLWGSSFGGGHVIELAAEHHDLLGAIAHGAMVKSGVQS